MKLPGIPVQILSAAVLLALGLVGIVAREGAARAGGQEVRLEIDGYDPRDLLTGHYVRFQMRSHTDAPCPPIKTAPDGWVALKRAGDHHVVSGKAATREAAAPLGEIVALGSAECIGFGPSITVLDLGVNRLHADQKRAEAVEKALRAARANEPAGFARVSIGKDGKARLLGIEIGGERLDLNWF